MLKKQDAPRLKKFIATIMKPGVTVSEMFQVSKDIEWLAKVALELDGPDMKVIKQTSLDQPKKNIKIKKKKK